ncbi:hypothetical protein M430DRAFT_48349 [Amorphotheca resinae ATCC 22711]|uniref:Uncharacterized protein n=1 Tax=Amorphotheca resinae ATCC 22711 TaxID=857342 RepID=A0A2T3B748_AMORE|nr:hypothetical protein M430DRAFT_48349 [Amorphotheca resinae ATCC 22711]PSS22704.1 hypothetical protein M430DRAFT_48349 [Amorphotheca resinae ATCC 22711]
MELLDLPLDLLHKILYHAVLARHVKRGLRLRLVCKVFSYNVLPALFETRLLDRFYSHALNNGGIDGPWYLNTHPGAGELWHSYLVYRVTNETDSTVGRFVEIRQTAQLICEETGWHLTSTIDKLCWIATESQASRPTTHEPTIKVTPCPALNGLAAAAHFNLIALANRLLLEGVCPTRYTHLFPSPMELAARSGHTEMIQLFQEHLPDHRDWNEGRWRWHGKVSPDSIYGATSREDMSIMQLVLYPPSRANSDSANILDQQSGRSDSILKVRESLRYAANFRARSPDFRMYIISLLDEEARPTHRDLVETLVVHAQSGNLSMVKHLLDLGVTVDGVSRRGGPPQTALIAACRGCHEEVVDLLLGQGADPNFGAKDVTCITALPMAASTGSLAIVRKLLDHGAQVNEAVEFWDGYYRRSAIWWAVAVEHTAMFQLLLERGASLEGWIGSTALEMAFELGMESMAKTLEGLGVKIIERVHDSGQAPWKRWSYYHGIYTSGDLKVWDW